MSLLDAIYSTKERCNKERESLLLPNHSELEAMIFEMAYMRALNVVIDEFKKQKEEK